MAERLALGIDLGGTAIKVGVVNRAGEIVSRSQVPTEVEKGAPGVIDNIARAAQAAVEVAGVKLKDLAGVGLGVPGICSVATGTVVTGVNLGWTNVPVASLLGDKLGVPVLLDNDANCAVLGEQWAGAAKGSDHVLMFTLGTGVGGGLILNGKIYHGFSGWAGEFGHMPAELNNGALCNCGRHGCLETVASASAMAAAAQRLIAAGQAPRMAALAAEQDGRVDARTVITAAREGDEAARGVLRQVATYLGGVAGGLVSALNPELILVGGGASNADELLMEPLDTAVRAHAMPGPGAVVRVAKAALGNDAGLIGAASLSWRQESGH